METMECVISEILPGRTRETMQYGSLKHLYLSGTLIDETDTSPWRIRIPNRSKLFPSCGGGELKCASHLFSADVINMVDKMIKAINEELSEEGLMSIGDAVLPHIQHWNRLLTLLCDQAVWAVIILPALLGVSALAILAVVLLTPVYLSVRVYECISESHLFVSIDTDVDGCLGSSNGCFHAIRIPVSWIVCVVGLNRVGTTLSLT